MGGSKTVTGLASDAACHKQLLRIMGLQQSLGIYIYN